MTHHLSYTKLIVSDSYESSQAVFYNQPIFLQYPAD
jgi:hypothetical protein